MIHEINIQSQEDIHLQRDILATRDGLQHVAGYIRTACVCQGDESSVEMQRQVIRDFCMQRFSEGCRLFWISDIPASGVLPWKRDDLEPGQYREGLTILVNLVKRGQIWNVCTSRIDRLARSAKLLIEFVDECIKPLGISLYSVTEMADRADSRDILATLAALETHKRNSLQSIATAAMHARIRDGYTVGKPPYGWISEDARKLRRSQRIGIEPVAAEVAIVRRIVSEFLEGSSLSQIARRLASDKVQSPGGARRWSPKVVRNVLLCPVHYGQVQSVDGSLVRGAHFNRRLFDESVYDQVKERLCWKHK